MKISLGRNWKLSLTEASSAQVITSNDVPLPLQMNRLPDSFVSKKFQPNKKKLNSVTAIEFVKNLAVNGHERKGSQVTYDEGNHLAFWTPQNFTNSCYPRVSSPLLFVAFLQNEFFSWNWSLEFGSAHNKHICLYLFFTSHKILLFFFK